MNITNFLIVIGIGWILFIINVLINKKVDAIKEIRWYRTQNALAEIAKIGGEK